mgnify:CR=1 FL=1
MSERYVASFTDAWIETSVGGSGIQPIPSHLLQMRGLKHQYNQLYKYGEESHLLQMRGLKPTFIKKDGEDFKVASFTDAWIETFIPTR